MKSAAALILDSRENFRDYHFVVFFASCSFNIQSADWSCFTIGFFQFLFCMPPVNDDFWSAVNDAHDREDLSILRWLDIMFLKFL